MASSKDGGHAVSDGIVTEYATYEDFLDSQITSMDLYYLEVGGLGLLAQTTARTLHGNFLVNVVIPCKNGSHMCVIGTLFNHF